MKGKFLLPSYLVAFALMVIHPIAKAAAPESCWRDVSLSAGTPVKLLRVEDSNSKLEFQAIFDVTVRLPGVTEIPRTIPEGKIVRLISSAGQIVLKDGPLQLISAHGRYTIQNSSHDQTNLNLSPTQGMNIRLPAAVSNGNLPAYTNAEIVFENGFVNAQLNASTYLTPTQPSKINARLNPGALPITRGGRTLTVDLYVFGVEQQQLKDERFQACFYNKNAGSINSQTTSVLATMAHIVSAQDNHVTLVLPIPNDFNLYTSLYDEVQLQILGPTLGVLSSEQKVYIGNPIFASILSIAIVLGLLYWIASRLPGADINAGISKRLLSFTTGVDGQTSLSLFQIYIWTTLVLAGMFYVFFMSGDLLNVSQQVLVLVGLAGIGSISARRISVETINKSPLRGSGFWGMFVAYGKPDLLRLQLFLFTISIWIYVAARVFYEQEFPELAPNVLLLMGISNGVYVGSKWAGSGNHAVILRLEEANITGEIIDLEARVRKLTDPTTQQAKLGSEQELKNLIETLDAKKKHLDRIKEEIG